MGYDDMHNIISKKQDVSQHNVQFSGILSAGYDLSYAMADNCQQISNIAESSYRTEGSATVVPENKVSQYTYDANGNLLSINTGTKQGDKLLATNRRKMLWDEENRLLSVSDNGFVSNYWYDAAGERTVKESGDGEGVLVNGVLSGARTGTSNYTLYVSPYTVVSNGGQMTKHIYIGGQRIASKLIAAGTMSNPMTATKAYWAKSSKEHSNLNFATKYSWLTASVKARYDSLGVTYKGTDHNGTTFYTAATAPALEAQEYFYHSDHLGSSSLITDADGNVTQHIEYIPYGEVFVEERNSTWSTPYKFSGKEQDEETGLYYYGARYYDPRTSVWASVDPLAEKYPNIGSYVYCADNPIKFIDPDGRKIKGVTIDKNGVVVYGKNVTKDTKIIADAMLKIEEGKINLKGLIDADYDDTLKMQEGKDAIDPDLLGHTSTNSDKIYDKATGKLIAIKIKSVEITLFKGKIQEMVDNYRGIKFKEKEISRADMKDKLYIDFVPTFNDMISTVATHEGKHGYDKNANDTYVTKPQSEKVADESEMKAIKSLMIQSTQ